MFSFPQTGTLVQLKKTPKFSFLKYINTTVLWVVKYIMSSFVSVLTVKIYENILPFFDLKEVWEIIWLRRQSPTQHGTFTWRVFNCSSTQQIEQEYSSLLSG